MTEVRRYPEGGAFNGVVRRTLEGSIPAWPQPRRATAGAPNVFVVLLDDVGFAQLGCYGSDIRTPTFDRLAANGLRYRDFHTTALCTPSRAALLTGRNHHAVGSGYIADENIGFPGYDGAMPQESGFLSEILRAQGYATFALGKWHLLPSWEVAAGSTKARWPLGRGFDRYYGFLGGRTSQWVPDLVYDNHPIAPPKTPEQGYHLNADMADRTIEFLADLRAADPDKPFFLYYATGAGHEPHHVPKDWADRYAGRFDLGWDRWREAVFARQLEMGIVPKGTQLSPRPEWIPAWDSIAPEARQLYARQMEVYAGFLEHTDHHIGRVVAFLEELGELDNTLFLVTSDNGACTGGGINGRSGGLIERASLEVNRSLIDSWGSPAHEAHYSAGWGWAGNTPMRRYKRFLHEGGISDPLIIHWPGGITARGEVRDQYAHIVDIAQTVLDVVGIDPPREIDGVAQRELHGVSLAHTFNDRAAPTKKTVQYYEMVSARAIWADGWKAVVEAETGDRRDQQLSEETLATQRWELYHVAEDPSESIDLADRHPEKLRELVELWWAEAGKYGVLPLDSRRSRGTDNEAEVRGEPVRSRYVYYPDAAPVPTKSAARVIDRSHRISADVVIPEGRAEGVLLAHGGGSYGGYSLYVKDTRLHYVNSYGRLVVSRISSREPIPSGTHTLALEYTRTGERRARVELFVDGRPVGDGEIEQVIPMMVAWSNDGLCCGYDSGQPVSDDYAAPFRFTGSIERVVVEVIGPPSDAHAKAMLAMLNRPG